MEMEDMGRSIEPTSFHQHAPRLEDNDDDDDDAVDQAATFERLHTSTCKPLQSLSDNEHVNGGKGDDQKGKTMVDVAKVGALERHLFIDQLLKKIEEDNLRLLKKQKERIDR
jgi:hypothetical protein